MKFEVDALGGKFSTSVEAENEAKAEEVALEELKEEFRHTVGIKGLKVYDVRLKYGNVKVGVLAASLSEAEQTAHEYIERRREKGLEKSNSPYSRNILQDLRTDVEVEGSRNHGPYEINRDGRWDEGELEAELLENDSEGKYEGTQNA